MLQPKLLGFPRGSDANRYYALQNDEEARAFLSYSSDGVNLRANYIMIMTAIRNRLQARQVCVNCWDYTGR